MPDFLPQKGVVVSLLPFEPWPGDNWTTDCRNTHERERGMSEVASEVEGIRFVSSKMGMQ